MPGDDGLESRGIQRAGFDELEEAGLEGVMRRQELAGNANISSPSAAGRGLPALPG
jgi:hypothetical protein